MHGQRPCDDQGNGSGARVQGEQMAPTCPAIGGVGRPSVLHEHHLAVKARVRERVSSDRNIKIDSE